MADAVLPDPVLIVLLGTAGSGKSALAGAWPPSAVLELDEFRERICDDPIDEDATDEAVHVLGEVLEARLARRLTTVVDADGPDRVVRAKLLDIAGRHRVPAAALIMTTPLETCLERNARRPLRRRVPDDVVRLQYAETVDATPGLPGEGFGHVEAVYGGPMRLVS
jgi:predicted kinase